MLWKRLLSLSLWTNLLASNFSSAASSSLSPFRSVTKLYCDFQSCGWFHLLSRPLRLSPCKQISYQVFSLLIICVFTGIALSISLRTSPLHSQLGLGLPQCGVDKNLLSMQGTQAGSLVQEDSRVSEQLSPRSTATEPVPIAHESQLLSLHAATTEAQTLEAVLWNRRSQQSEKPKHHKKE